MYDDGNYSTPYPQLLEPPHAPGDADHGVGDGLLPQRGRPLVLLRVRREVEECPAVQQAEAMVSLDDQDLVRAAKVGVEEKPALWLRGLLSELYSEVAAAPSPFVSSTVSKHSRVRSSEPLSCIGGSFDHMKYQFSIIIKHASVRSIKVR